MSDATYYSKDYVKEASLLSTIIHHEVVSDYGTLFGTFDICFEIAILFIDKYGVDDVTWGEELIYDETVIEFARQYIKDNNIRF